MTLAETEKLAKRIRKAEQDDAEVESMVKELVIGVAINIARIADALEGKKP